MKRLYRNARIASEDSPKLETADVLVEGGRIIGVAGGMTGVSDAEEIDCAGRVLLPALFDVHVHAREPGQEQKENIASCAEAAINGGVTGFVMMPNTSPAIDNGGMVQTVLDSARATRIGRSIFTTGAITKNRKGEALAGIAGMKKAGAVMLTDDGAPVENPQVLRRAMEYARDHGLALACHCEMMALSGKGCMHEGSVSYSLGLPGIPSISEEICIARDIRLAEFTGVHLHIQHVTTARGNCSRVWSTVVSTSSRPTTRRTRLSTRIRISPARPLASRVSKPCFRACSTASFRRTFSAGMSW